MLRMLMECRSFVGKGLYISLCWSLFDQNLVSMLNEIIQRWHSIFFIAVVCNEFVNW